MYNKITPALLVRFITYLAHLVLCILMINLYMYHVHVYVAPCLFINIGIVKLLYQRVSIMYKKRCSELLWETSSLQLKDHQPEILHSNDRRQRTSKNWLS